MKFIKNLFSRTAPAKPIIVGITESDYIKIYNGITDELNLARARQKDTVSKPNQYMQGLMKALKILDSIRPYNIAEV